MRVAEPIQRGYSPHARAVWLALPVASVSYCYHSVHVLSERLAVIAGSPLYYSYPVFRLAYAHHAHHLVDELHATITSVPSHAESVIYLPAC